MHTLFAYVGAAIAEIGGCFAFWAYIRLGKPVWWLIPGTISLLLFAYLLTLVDSPAAGRTYAAYCRRRWRGCGASKDSARTAGT
jgi:small multidrug resistance family-3 protein